MRLITRRSNAAEAAEKWVNQYPPNESPTEFGGGRDSITIRESLAALGPYPDPDEVDRIIGNKSWTAVPSCDECGVYPPQIVMLGGDDEEDHVVTVCGNCLIKALNLHEENT